jgi:hypothetical protein
MFSISKCPAGCIIFDIGFFGVTFLRNECVRKEWFSVFDFDTSGIELTEDDLP